jgi:uncharacterized membrane protein
MGLTYANFGNKIPYVTNILTLINILVLMVFMHFMRYQNRKYYQEYDEKHKTAEDFTIVMRNIPKRMRSEEIK